VRARRKGTDRDLVSVLTRHARISNAELARRVGLSPSACLARVRRLERSGVILGYRAVVGGGGSPEIVEGWADIRFIDPTPVSLEQFTRLVKAAPEIVEAHRIAGQYDYHVRFCAGDMNAWNSFRRRLEAIGCAAQARFSILVEPLK
jgi:DNA-binding Lrp family transcriptional regulator